MRILPRRLLASYLGWLAACGGGLLLALAIVDMLVDFDAVVEGGGPALLALVARVPARWLREALPLASFAAAFLATALPARRGEILAVRAAGIHPARVTLPILAAALALGAAFPWLPEPAVASASAALEPAERTRDGVAWRHEGGRVWRIGPIDPAAGRRDLRLFELDPEFRLRSRLRASAALAAGDALELRGARVLRFDPANPGARARAGAAPASLALPAAEGAGGGACASAAASAPARAAAGAAVAVLALLAVPLGLGARPAAGLAGRALAALALAALFRGAWQLADFAAERDSAAEALAPATALAAFAALAAALWAKVPR